ncbi:MAG TPA: serine/threonine-protein kinase [Thermoanaerobaculia bacterium]|jgi:serine/threonine protein kinase
MTRADDIRNRIVSIGKYEVADEIHEGASAYVFRGRHVPLGEDVVLKVYDVDASSDAEDLYREARLLKRISEESGCNNLVRVFDVERLSDDEVLMAMELVNGGSLLTQLTVRGPLALMDAVRVTKGIIRGTAELHARNLVHRDLKPANIMLDAQQMTPKIGDFGSIAELNEDGLSVRTSRRSALYIPPECWEVPPRHGRSSDLYQIGMVLHELVNGPLPSTAEAQLDAEAHRRIRKAGGSKLADLDAFAATQIVDNAIERRARQRKLLTMVNWQPYIPNALVRVIGKATAPKVTSRFSSSIDFLAALEKFEAPNWRREGAVFTASNWRGCEWRVSEQRGGWLAERRKTADYRAWRTAEDSTVLFDAILDVRV